jgi:hypothetical protein
MCLQLTTDLRVCTDTRDKYDNGFVPTVKVA